MVAPRFALGLAALVTRWRLPSGLSRPAYIAMQRCYCTMTWVDVMNCLSPRSRVADTAPVCYALFG